MLELDSLAQSNHGAHTGKHHGAHTGKHCFVLDGDILSSCRGDDAMQNVSRGCAAIIKDRSLLLPGFIKIHLKQGSYKKLNLKFKNIQEHFWGENKFVQEHFRRVIRTFYLQYYQQSHFVP